jgi:hypothetical protein
MCEQTPVKQLVSSLAGVEAAGFDFSVISDHHFPWLVTADGVASAVSCGPDVAAHVQAVKEFADAGFADVALATWALSSRRSSPPGRRRNCSRRCASCRAG